MIEGSKSRPILFSASMVRALLAGTKTQTRRVVKPAVAEAIEWAGGGPSGEDATTDSFTLSYARHTNDRGDSLPPEFLVSSADYPEEGVIPIGQGYGTFGDTLWVRETWAWPGEEEVIYRADPQAEELLAHWHRHPMATHTTWKPSIHMPRALSRITLRITFARIERLQDISEADCAAEGIPIATSGTVPQEFGAGRRMYRQLWESINGAGSWDVNPWVWVVSFERITEGTPAWLIRANS